MRIFLVISSAATGGMSSSRIWLMNLYEPLKKLGHDVFLFPAEKGFAARSTKNDILRHQFSNDLINTFKRENMKKNFELFFSYLYDGTIDREAIEYIQGVSVPTCNFSCNNIHQFDLVREISPWFDYALHSEIDVGDRFIAINANPVWFPMAANPDYYYPRKEQYTYIVSFVGQQYARRAYYILQLLNNDIDIHSFGPGWSLPGGLSKMKRNLRRQLTGCNAVLRINPKKQIYWSSKLYWLDISNTLRKKYPDNLHLPVSDEDMIRLYSQSQISLGFSEVFSNHDPSSRLHQHLHLRDFEAPMCGALYTTGYSEEITNFYEPDKEIILYHSIHELLDKVKYYLSHPEKGLEIRRRARIRAVKCHTYTHRFKDLFKTLGLE